MGHQAVPPSDESAAITAGAIGEEDERRQRARHEWERQADGEFAGRGLIEVSARRSDLETQLIEGRTEREAVAVGGGDHVGQRCGRGTEALWQGSESVGERLASLGAADDLRERLADDGFVRVGEFANRLERGESRSHAQHEEVHRVGEHALDVAAATSVGADRSEASRHHDRRTGGTDSEGTDREHTERGAEQSGADRPSAPMMPRCRRRVLARDPAVRTGRGGPGDRADRDRSDRRSERSQCRVDRRSDGHHGFPTMRCIHHQPICIEGQTGPDAERSDRRGHDRSDVVVGRDEHGQHQQRHRRHHVRRQPCLCRLCRPFVEVGRSLAEQHGGLVDRSCRRPADPTRRGDHAEGQAQVSATSVDTGDRVGDRGAAVDRQSQRGGRPVGGGIGRDHRDRIAQGRARSETAGDVVAPGGDATRTRGAASGVSTSPHAEGSCRLRRTAARGRGGSALSRPQRHGRDHDRDGNAHGRDHGLDRLDRSSSPPLE